MNTNRTTRGFTRVELLVVVVVIAALLVFIIPAVNSAREAERRASCMSREHMLGVAMQTYAATFNNRFPPSASVTKAPDGSTQTVGGWSHLVRLLPFMDWDSLYKTLPADGDPEDTSNQAIVAAMNTQMREFICPSSPWRFKPSQSAGITNYKAMGATTRRSLVMVVNPQATPPYGTMTPIRGTAPLHPDGTIFPGDGTRCADVLDGLSHSIVMIETMDQAASRWFVGEEATLVGMPQSSSATGTTPQPGFNFFAPPGYETAVARTGLRTFLAYDFSPGGADAGKYEDPGFGQTPSAYGPSSMHPAVVICGMGDGSVQVLSKQIDAANLFFLITKNDNDPVYWP